MNENPEITERIQKTLARAGLGSRRQIEEAIRLGQLVINAKTVELGQKLQSGDRIVWKNRIWLVEESYIKPRVLMFHKPEGLVTTRQDELGRPTVFDKLPQIKGQKWLNIGRLDINTTGLLLFTTDGDFAHHMSHPSAQIDREYACRIFGDVDEAMIERLLNGVELEDGPANFTDIQVAVDDKERSANHWIYVAIMEGRNREVRRLWESQGVQVSRLKRVRYGGVFLPKNLLQGKHRELNDKELDILFTDSGYQPATASLTIKSVAKKRR